MKVVVFGGGMIGSLIASEISKEYDVAVLDNCKDKLEKIKYRNNNIETINLDVKGKKVEKILEDYDLAINCLPGFIGFKILKRIIKCRVSCVDISFMPQNCMELSELALEKGCLVIPDAGVAPGLSNLIVGHIVSKSKIHEIQTMVGGLPKKKAPPWNYKAPFSPIDVIEEYTRPARIKTNGKIEVKPALSKKLKLEVEGIGELEAFLTDGLRTLLDSASCVSSVPNLTEYTLRYPGHCNLIKKMISEGELSDERTYYKGKEMTKKEKTCKQLFKLWKLGEEEEEFTFMLVIATDTDGKEISYTIYDEFTDGWSSMARTTGLTACAFSKLVLEKEIEGSGIICPEKIGMESRLYDFVLDYLKERGISIKSHN